VPPRASTRQRMPDRGMQVLEQKLSILALGPSQTRRNPALDVLTGRVPDERLQSLKASLLSARSAALPDSSDGTPPSSGPSAPMPSAMVLPIAAIRMAAVARKNRVGPSPWLQAPSGARPRLRLVSPPPSRLSQVPWLGSLLVWLRVEHRPYTSRVRSPRAHPAS
jgi:hypothetical protein